MLKMRPYAPPDRIAIRDSIDEEISDDIEDDVFIRDGKSAKFDEEKGLKRPLMAPRYNKNNKNATNHHHHHHNSQHHHPIPIMKKHRRCWKCCEPFCYGLAAITILIMLILIAAFILTLFPFPIQKIKSWLKSHDNKFSSYSKYYGNEEYYNSNIDKNMFNNELVPCTQISVQRVWSKTFSRINSESPVRKADLNNDQIDDIIFGYGVDDSVQYEDVVLPKCISTRLEDEIPCEGGVIALNGINGEIIWQRWSVANVFSLFCTIDIDKDGYPDCVAAGRGGLIFAINGRNGNVIWNFREVDVETNSPILIDLYTINIVRDLNDDEVPDVLAVHVEERETSRAGHIKLISGKNGNVIRSIPTPYREEVFVPLQIITKSDGTELLMIITGGQNTPGGIYSIRLMSLMQYTSEKEFSSLFQTDLSGFMVPAILSDINGDSIEDIIVSSFNSTIYAFDGHNYKMLWNYTFPASESVSSIVPGHFDHDNITDFMVKYNTGPGFPVYYYSQTTILNGVNGQPLLDLMMTDSGGPNSLLGGLSISQTFGGDFFLHWQTQCRGKPDVKDAYEFVPDSDIILQARADTCLLRYNTSTVLKLYAIARHVEPPGAVIFSTDDLGIHLNRTDNRQLIQQNSVSPLKHPKMLKKLLYKEFPGLKENTNTRYLQQQQLNRNNILNAIEDTNNKKYKNLKNFKEFNAINYRKPIIENQIIPEQQQLQQQQQQDNTMLDNNVINRNNNPYGQMKSYFYMPFNNQPGREFKDYEIPEQQKSQDEYETIYNDEQQNDRPIHLRSKYPSINSKNNNINNNNRGVRSDYIDDDYDRMINFNNDVVNETLFSNTTPTMNLKTIMTTKVAATDTTLSSVTIADEIIEKNENIKKNQTQKPLTLWDLEMEKENEDSVKESNRYDYVNNENNNVEYNDDRHRHKRDTGSSDSDENSSGSNGSNDNSNSDNNNNNKETDDIINDNENNDNGILADSDYFLSSISSTGVLLQSLDKNSLSSIDFTFVLNVRESETYPPLFLPQDLNCVEDKMSAYRSYTSDDLLALEKQFLKQCLKARLNNITPNIPRYESQIIVTRISITCTCGHLQPGEICSKLKNINEQKWTNFMGNDGNGLYK